MCERLGCLPVWQFLAKSGRVQPIIYWPLLAQDHKFFYMIAFDVSVSVHQTGNNKYMLKPVIRGYLEAAIGSMPGTYNVTFYANPGYSNKTVGGVVVSAGNITQMGMVTIE
jgi:hypothetical protein